MSDESKEMQLVRAICRVNNLCRELGLPDLVDRAASDVIIDAGRTRTLHQLEMFKQELGWENRPVPKHKM